MMLAHSRLLSEQIDKGSFKGEQTWSKTLRSNKGSTIRKGLLMKQVSRLDYFTLQVFIGLVELKNGSAVADKLNTTQSKVSRALSCMREVLCDELFVRQKYGFEPNRLALKITPMVQAVLQQYDKIIAATSDKKISSYELTVAAYEHWSFMVLNCIQQSCHCVEGGVHVNVLPWSENVGQRLSQGKIDCSISIAPINHPMVTDRKIGDITHFFIVARAGHPLLESPQPLVDIFKYNIGLVNSNLQNNQQHPIEEYAQANDIDIRVVLKSPSVNMVIDHVSNTEDVCILSSAMSFYYFENRTDLGFVDISSDWLKTFGLTCDSYYLHCHQTVLPQLVSCLELLLTDKLREMQDHYDNTIKSIADTHVMSTCCSKNNCTGLECHTDCHHYNTEPETT